MSFVESDFARLPNLKFRVLILAFFLIVLGLCHCIGAESTEQQEIKMVTYQVRPGDTLATVADRFYIDVDTLRGLNVDQYRGVNNFKGIRTLVPGMIIEVVDQKGIFYRVREGQTLSDLSNAFKVKIEDILKANGISKPERLRMGQEIFIPGAKPLDRASGRLLIKLKRSIRAKFARPLDGNLSISSGYGDRRKNPVTGLREVHRGVDLRAAWGTPIHAAADGIVEFVGWMGGYGRLVILDHKGSLSTYYGHTSKSFVDAGQRVKKGQVIAQVGSTGSSTGPHLHFEVRRNGKPVSPYVYLGIQSVTVMSRRAAVGGE